MSRRVDHAMEANRPQKRVVRQLWLEEVRRLASQPRKPHIPLYLTLPGAEGRDIEFLAQNGVISLTGVHGITAEDKGKIVAVESSPLAILSLQAKFPGLKIIEAPIQSLLRGDSPTRWPDGEHEILCRARVVNLDVDEPLVAIEKNSRILFPLLERVRKFAVIHGEDSPSEWVLLLTVHGECPWNESVSRSVQEFLSENCNREPSFAAGFRQVVGDSLADDILSKRVRSFRELAFAQQQRLLAVFVPKKIASLVYEECWVVITRWTFCYGGEYREAPMTTWAFSFQVDSRASVTPDKVYRESLRNVFRRIGEIKQDGSIQDQVTR